MAPFLELESSIERIGCAMFTGIMVDRQQVWMYFLDVEIHDLQIKAAL